MAFQRREAPSPVLCTADPQAEGQGWDLPLCHDVLLAASSKLQPPLRRRGTTGGVGKGTAAKGSGRGMRNGPEQVRSHSNSSERASQLPRLFQSAKLKIL